jgi:hypothetical protein
MKPTKIYDFPRGKFPITLRIFSGKDGSEIWMTTVPAPTDARYRLAVSIPHYAGTEHHPVRVRMEYGDGTIEDG